MGTVKPQPAPRAVSTTYPSFPERIPPGFAPEDGAYAARFAQGPQDLRAVQRLRYEVFNLELGEGLDASHASGLDEDPFDAQCHHLVVEHRVTREVVGTYRLQTSAMAEGGLGFYSAQEFDFTRLPAEVLERSVETGRACIAAEHRHRHVLLLLWKGLGRYAVHNRCRYLFGCCSLTSQDPAEGQQVLEYLRRSGHVREEVDLPARPECVCRADAVAIPDWQQARIPMLFRTYLRYGAKVWGEPAIDREFKTIDFLAVLDFHELDPVRILRQFEVDISRS